VANQTVAEPGCRSISAIAAERDRSELFTTVINGGETEMGDLLRAGESGGSITYGDSNIDGVPP